MVAVTLAFFGSLRTFIWAVYAYIITWLAVHTGLYRVCFVHNDKLGSQTWIRRTEREVSKPNEEVKSARARKIKGEYWSITMKEVLPEAGEP